MNLRNLLKRFRRPGQRFALTLSAMVVLGGVAGCDLFETEEDEELCKLEWEDATIDDQTICAAGNFSGTSSTITNAFLPFAAGSSWVLEGEEDGEAIRIETTVMGTATVAGVAVRVVNEAEYVDSVLAEDTLDWYAQANDGSVCYFGEDVTNYEDDGSTNSEGSWTADYTTAEPGIIMPAEADIEVGAIYVQERVPDIAEDMSEIVDIGEAISTAAGDYSDTFTGYDCNPLEREEVGEDKKIYARNVGLVFDAGVELIQYTP